MTVPIKGGRPKAFNSTEEMQQLIDEYFDYCDSLNIDDEGKKKINKPYTLTGLCDYLDIVRDTWNDYSKKSEYSDTCKKAKQRIESFTLELASTNKLNPVITIFNLKNNFGWVDKIEVNTTTSSDQLTNDDIKAKIDALKKERKDIDIGES